MFAEVDEVWGTAGSLIFDSWRSGDDNLAVRLHGKIVRRQGNVVSQRKSSRPPMPNVASSFPALLSSKRRCIASHTARITPGLPALLNRAKERMTRFAGRITASHWVCQFDGLK